MPLNMLFCIEIMSYTSKEIFINLQSCTKFKGRKCTFECNGAITCLKTYKYSSIDFVLMNVIYQCAGYHKHLSTCISDVAHLAMRASLINNVSASINIPTVYIRLLLVKNKGSRPDY